MQDGEVGSCVEDGGLELELVRVQGGVWAVRAIPDDVREDVVDKRESGDDDHDSWMGPFIGLVDDGWGQDNGGFCDGGLWDSGFCDGGVGVGWRTCVGLDLRSEGVSGEDEG